jgi:hypothetical protein
VKPNAGAMGRVFSPPSCHAGEYCARGHKNYDSRIDVAPRATCRQRRIEPDPRRSACVSAHRLPDPRRLAGKRRKRHVPQMSLEMLATFAAQKAAGLISGAVPFAPFSLPFLRPPILSSRTVTLPVTRRAMHRLITGSRAFQFHASSASKLYGSSASGSYLYGRRIEHWRAN